MKRGDIFIHKFWLNEKNEPLKCRVTKIQHGVIFYRPVDGGKPAYFPIEQAARYIGSYLSLTT